MRGFPTYFNTKQDVLNVIAVYPVETKAFLKRCLDERFSWLPSKTKKQEFLVAGKKASFSSAQKMAKGEKSVIDATHRVVEIKDEATKEVTERYQEEYREDPNCQLFRLGFTVDEVEKLLD
jgi:hypothetical protein